MSVQPKKLQRDAYLAAAIAKLETQKATLLKLVAKQPPNSEIRKAVEALEIPKPKINPLKLPDTRTKVAVDKKMLALLLQPIRAWARDFDVEATELYLPKAIWLQLDSKKIVLLGELTQLNRSYFYQTDQWRGVSRDAMDKLDSVLAALGLHLGSDYRDSVRLAIDNKAAALHIKFAIRRTNIWLPRYNPQAWTVKYSKGRDKWCLAEEGEGWNWKPYASKQEAEEELTKQRAAMLPTYRAGRRDLLRLKTRLKELEKGNPV